MENKRKNINKKQNIAKKQKVPEPVIESES